MHKTKGLNIAILAAAAMAPLGLAGTAAAQSDQYFNMRTTNAHFGVDRATSSPGQGELRVGFQNPDGCEVNNVRVRYHLGQSMGEPTVAGSWAYDQNSSARPCSPPTSTIVLLRIQMGSNIFGYVKLDPAMPRANGGFGYNSPGSPDWDQLICSYNGAIRTQCMSAGEARAVWSQGRVAGAFLAW